MSLTASVCELCGEPRDLYWVRLGPFAYFLRCLDGDACHCRQVARRLIASVYGEG